MNIKELSHEELSVLEKIKDNDLMRPLGLMRAMAMLIVVFVVIFIAAMDWQIPYGVVWAHAAVIGGIFISLRQLYLVVTLQDKLIDLIAKRTGLKVVEKYTMVCEGSIPQLYDENTKTFYRIFADSDGVSVKAIRDI